LRNVAFMLAGLTATLCAGIRCAGAQDAATDPNLAHPTQVVTVKRDGYTIAGLVTHLAGAKGFKYGIALFPGHPGIMRLREEEGRLAFDLRGNFLVRSRRHWLDEETLVAVLDAPSDEWASFTQRFRETARYGADVAALIAEIGRKYGVEDWTFVGTSEGSISAFHAARMNPAIARRVILTASVIRAGRNGPGLSGVDYSELKSRLLWVNHEDDPCDFTSYSLVKSAAQRSGAPLVKVSGGGPSRGAACMAFTQHGFVGVEAETVLAMRSWIRTGAIPQDVVPRK
jgi:pimeloyl-ACP methyl ester carboxylesterase